MNPIIQFRRCLVAGILCFSLHANSQSVQAQPKPVEFPKSDAFAGSKLSYKIISAASNSFGYDIFSDGKLLIHQPSVPGMPGNKGFGTSKAAESVAQLVVKKIKNGEMPPTVSIEEMQKLKAIQK